MLWDAEDPANALLKQAVILHWSKVLEDAGEVDESTWVTGQGSGQVIRLHMRWEGPHHMIDLLGHRLLQYFLAAKSDSRPGHTDSSWP